MTIPPSQPGRASRATLAARLTELRMTAGLSGNALAKRMGVVQSRVNKIEHPEKPPHLIPNEDDIRAWVAATAGDAQTVTDLLDMLAKAEKEKKFSALFGRKGGAVALEERVRAAEEQATRIGEFEVAVIPGILQTADYARELLGVASGPRAWGSDDADVEDKIIKRVREIKTTLREFTGQYEAAFLDDLRKLNCRLPHHTPRAPSVTMARPAPIRSRARTALRGFLWPVSAR